MSLIDDIPERLKELLRVLLSVFTICVMLFASSDLAGPKAHASAQSRRIVTDSVSGYALYGYDPIAYYTEHAAIRGKRDHEYVWKGVSWLFSTRANREVFRENPEVYAPQYGGHGALAMARGYASGSNPLVWALYGNRLYLFYSYTARAAWAEAIDLHVQRADENWVDIENQLTR